MADAGNAEVAFEAQRACVVYTGESCIEKPALSRR